MIDLKKAVRAAIATNRARNSLYGSASIAALYAIGSPAMAADEPLEEIVVSGYRASLQSAQDIKKESDVVVDSVTAADIGSMPDRSVSETLQRIPGVTINRFAAGVDPDHFSVEGSGVTIRGLSYIHSEFNGRDTFTANNGRALSFADVPAEMLHGVDVFKSPSADRIEGGIGGVVNLRTRVPFDSKGFLAAGSLEESYGDFEKEYTPSASALMSNRWQTGIGEFGALGMLSYSQLKSRSDKLMVSNFFNRGQNSSTGAIVQVPPNPGTLPPGNNLVYAPRGAVAGSQSFDRVRHGISAAMQWRSPDDKWEALAQFIKSDARESWTEHTTEIATDNVAGGSAPEQNGSQDSRPTPNTTWQFDNSGLFTSGYVTGTSTGWRAETGDPVNGVNAVLNRRVPENALQSNNIVRGVEQKYVTKDYSLNLKWKATDNLAFDFDYQHTDSSVDNLDVGLWTSTYQDVFIGLSGDGGSKIPYVMFQPPTNCIPGPCAPSGTPSQWSGSPSLYYNAPTTLQVNTGTSANPVMVPVFVPGHQSYLDPYNSFYRASMDHIEQSEGEQDALRLDGTFAFAENNWLKSIKTGVRYAKREQTARFSTYNWGVLSEQWGGAAPAGPVWLDDPITGNGGRPLASYEHYNFNNFMKGAAASPLGPQGRLFYAGNPAKDYATFWNISDLVMRTWRPQTNTLNSYGARLNDGWNSLWMREKVIPGTPFLPGEINEVTETNNAAYLMANLAHKFDMGWKLSGNVGLRYTKTKREAPGFVQYGPLTGTPSDGDCNNVAGNQVPPAFCRLSLTERARVRSFFQYTATPTNDGITYSYVLPSLNVKLDTDNGWQYRFAYFKGIAQPEFGFTRNFYNVSSGTALLTFDANNNLVDASAYARAASGSARIKPVESDNYDVTVEWYFSNVGQLTMAMFYKELEGIVTNNQVRLEPGGPVPADVNPLAANLTSNNGATLPVVLSYPANSKDKGKIKGVEFGYQQTFDFLPGFLSGFGINANYTYVDSEGVKQGTLSATDPDVGAGRTSTVDTSKLPLQGLSKNSYNITPFYQSGPIEIRFAYNWRSEYLLTPRDVIVPFQPIIQEAFGSLDASAFYSFTNNVKLGLQIANLNNAVTKTRAVINNDLKEAPRGFYVNDRRYTLGLRWTFE
jgi:TonB-dependent receptor